MEEWLVEQTKEEASNLVTYNSLKRSEVTFNCMLHVSCGFAERFHPVTYISCAISLNNIICMLHIRLFFTLILFSVWCTLSIYRFILFQCCHESTKMTIDNVLKTFCKVFHLDYRSNTLIVWYQIQSWLCRLGNIQLKLFLAETHEMYVTRIGSASRPSEPRASEPRRFHSEPSRAFVVARSWLGSPWPNSHEPSERK